MTDTHTHAQRPGAVINIDPAATPISEIRLLPGHTYSVGIHPWNADAATDADLRTVAALAASPRVVAIGEVGLDLVHESYRWQPIPGRRRAQELVQCAPSLRRQLEILMFHIRLSEQLGKPLILHIVKRYPEIIRLRNSLRPAPTQPWIIHGYRGKPGLAADLLKFGFHLSYGEFANPLSVAATPPSRLHFESDESPAPVSCIARQHAHPTPEPIL